MIFCPEKSCHFTIAEATCEAASIASEERLIPYKDKNSQALPARPLVLGGDDLTIIVRGDLALDFTQTFIENFENETSKAFSTLKHQQPIFQDLLPDNLTACAGIAFIKANQPFYLAYDLAEGMCDHAKRERKAKGTNQSALVFSRVTTSFIPGYRELRDKELAVSSGSNTFYMTLGNYFLGPSSDNKLPRLDDLRSLKELLARPTMARGPARKLLGLLHSQPNEAKISYARWKQNLTDANRLKPTDRRLIDLNEALSRLGVDPDTDLPYRCTGSSVDQKHYATPLGDALAWLAVDGSMEAQDED